MKCHNHKTITSRCSKRGQPRFMVDGSMSLQLLIVLLVLLDLMMLAGSSEDRRGIVFAMGPRESHCKLFHAFIVAWSAIFSFTNVGVYAIFIIVVAYVTITSIVMGVYATAKVIRETSSIPIEVWTYAFEIPQLPTSAIQALQSVEGLTMKVLPDPIPITSLHDLRDEDLKDMQKGRSWQTDYLHFSAKPLALITSNFTEIMLVDSDAVLFVSPEEIFATVAYSQTGTLFLHDKFIDFFPYKSHDPMWMENFLTTFDRSAYATTPISAQGVEPVMEVEKSGFDEKNLLSAQFTSSTFYTKRAPVNTQHLAESSLVLFHKLKQLRATEILKALTVKHHEEVYRQVYGDKETYWMACELAGADYSFSPYGPSHWAALTSNSTCPDLVIDPTFVHYMPEDNVRVMSMNQFKFRHLKKFERKGPIKRKSKRKPSDNVGDLPILATSQRDSRQVQMKEYVDSLRLCRKGIAPMRKVQRCWSSKVPCTILPQTNLLTLKKHAKFQMEASKIYKMSSSIVE